MRSSRSAWGIGLALLAANAVCVGTVWSESDRSGETMFEKIIDVEPGGTLKVDIPDADLDVEVGGGDKVEIEVLVGGRSMDRARERFEAMNFRTETAGNVVSLLADQPKIGFFSSMGGNVWVTARIWIPRNFNVDLRTGDGDVSVDGVEGDVAVRTGDGDVRLGAVHGRDVSVETGDGDVHAYELQAPAIILRTGDGDISVDAIDGKSTRVRTGDGDVHLDAVSGPIEVSTGDGSIDILIDRLGQTSLQTGDGDVTLRSLEDLAADLDLRGGDVELSGADEFDGRRDDDEIQGRVNGGGPPVKIRTGDGDVLVVARGKD